MNHDPRLAPMQQFIDGTAYRGIAPQLLAADASFRRYFRVVDGLQSAVVMDAPPGKEPVQPFMAIAEALHGAGFAAPRIMARDEAKGFLLLEDLGSRSFTRELAAGSADEMQLYSAAVDVLAAWAVQGKLGTLALPPYDEALLVREVMLFAQWFLPQVVGQASALALQPGYEALWRGILREAGLGQGCFVHRDYHADNLMWLPARQGHGRVGLLDFQDAVYGDAAYDMVSLLEDARRDVPQALAEAMIARFLAQTGLGCEAFLMSYAVLAAQRNSKIVGIFTRLSARDGKAHYLHYLPRVWAHLEHDLVHPALAPLKVWLAEHVPPSARGVVAVTQPAALAADCA